MKSRMRIRTWCLLATLTMVCLSASSSFAANPLVFHLARFEYIGTTANCADPSNPVSKLVKTSGGDVAKLQASLARAFPNGNECVQALMAEAMLAVKVVEYLQNKGLAAISHLDQFADLEQQMAKDHARGDEPYLLHCVITPDTFNANQLNFACTIKPLHGDCVGARNWQHPKQPLNKLVDLFNVEASEKVDQLCENAQKTVRH